MKILVLNGPNLNFLGIREPAVYGKETYQDLVDFLHQLGNKNNVEINVKQSNIEGVLIDYLQEAYFEKYDAVVMNPGAFTHYSYAIRDAISSVQIPTVEVHLSDITKREEFRKISVVREVCERSFFGKHFQSYEEAIDYLIGKYNTKNC